MHLLCVGAPNSNVERPLSGCFYRPVVAGSGLTNIKKYGSV